MLNRYKIGTKVILLVLFLTLVAVVTETIISHMRSKETLREDSFSTLEDLSKVYEARLDLYFQSIEGQLEIVTSIKGFQTSFDSLYTYSSSSFSERTDDLTRKKDVWNNVMKNEVFKKKYS